MRVSRDLLKLLMIAVACAATARIVDVATSPTYPPASSGCVSGIAVLVTPSGERQPLLVCPDPADEERPGRAKPDGRGK